MRRIPAVLMFLGFSLAACAADMRPTGEEVFGALLANDDIDLAMEPLCKADIRLHQQLALSLSVSHESRNTTRIMSSCEPSKFESRPDQVIDIWDCEIRIIETDPKDEFISSSAYRFGITKDKQHRFVEGSLRCL